MLRNALTPLRGIRDELWGHCRFFQDVTEALTTHMRASLIILANMRGSDRDCRVDPGVVERSSTGSVRRLKSIDYDMGVGESCDRLHDLIRGIESLRRGSHMSLASRQLKL